ncbi:MAG: hypothetical protein IJ941_05655, partial [Clostridia bacterium]|nr:hypothetical protein [Clostridia bacterium]
PENDNFYNVSYENSMDTDANTECTGLIYHMPPASTAGAYFFPAANQIELSIHLLYDSLIIQFTLRRI